MQVHDLSKGRVITLDANEDPAKNEQFRLTPPGTGDPTWYATRVETVTVHHRQGNTPAYFTAAGQQINAPGDFNSKFWEMPVKFNDSGVLPPHVRDKVEPFVPVADRDGGREYEIVARRSDYEFAPPEAQAAVIEQIRADEHAAVTSRVVASPNPVGQQPGPLGAIDSSKTWAERMAAKGKRSALTLGAIGGGSKPFAEPLNAGRQVPQALPPSAFLSSSQLRESR